MALSTTAQNAYNLSVITFIMLVIMYYYFVSSFDSIQEHMLHIRRCEYLAVLSKPMSWLIVPTFYWFVYKFKSKRVLHVTAIVLLLVKIIPLFGFIGSNDDSFITVFSIIVDSIILLFILPTLIIFLYGIYTSGKQIKSGNTAFLQHQQIPVTGRKMFYSSVADSLNDL